VRVAQAKAEVHDIISDFCAASARDAAGPGGGGGAGGSKDLGGAVGDTPTGADARLLVWVELPEAPEGGERLAPGWDLLWTWKAPRVALNELLPWQRVNHFPHSRQLTRKDLLKKNLQRARAAPGRSDGYDVMPLTFALPAEYNSFAMAFAACREQAEQSGGANVWIMKPTGCGASRGRRIALLNDIQGVSYGEAVVLQRYVERPLLLDGLKFDLRLYVLVTSFNPLEAFLYTEGFGRFATEPYTLDPARLGDLYVHLTNSSIQMQRPAGEGARIGVAGSDEGGSKCSLRGLAARLAAAGVPWPDVWASIREVVLRSLAAVQDAIPHQRNSFELFGYDILIDEQLKCWLIEVNASPSLARDNPLDFAIKDRLVADTLQLVAPPYFDRAIWAEMLRARLEPRGGVRPAKGAPAAELADELCAMLHGEPPRLYGQMPAQLGLYERIAPSPLWDRVCRKK
jgi:tubulin polyglutamylase TTLL5